SEMESRAQPKALDDSERTPAEASADQFRRSAIVGGPAAESRSSATNRFTSIEGTVRVGAATNEQRFKAVVSGR
ncbi:MAG TPA: hypothetical protein VEA63_05085, partial [Opitutus sp.]|nr:hypothetical protein [Opitutus sp.]